MVKMKTHENPFRPGAGHRPPYLAGRENEIREFIRLLDQKVILNNLVLTGLRGVGKTVLLDTFKPHAIERNWLWIGTDLSESATVSEDSIAIRLLTDLSTITSSIVIAEKEIRKIGFMSEPHKVEHKLDYSVLKAIYDKTPGLVLDKLKFILELIWTHLSQSDKKGLIFAYDEAQNMADHSAKEQYPLSVLLDLFQSIQKKNIPFMLVFTGLPTLFPKLVEARTFSERMFRVVFLDKLNDHESRMAITKPIEDANCPIKLNEESIGAIIKLSAGYPYFIQFICREVYDSFLQGQQSVPTEAIIRKLDSDFFSGRWSRATDRQRELLRVIAMLENCDTEFTVQEIVDLSGETLQRPFSSSHVNQMLVSLGNVGLVYKNRHGKYSFAVPLLGQYIRRQAEGATG